MPHIRRSKRLYRGPESKIEARIRKRGFTDLKWCPAAPEGHCFDDMGWILYACPKNYKGPYEDYREEVACSIVDPKHQLNGTLGYRLLRWTNN
ncbi:MAG: hypothetical protein WC796_05610 [Candidatus Pacearchaeota archaeon]|jgi:hypothetical protein